MIVSRVTYVYIIRDPARSSPWIGISSPSREAIFTLRSIIFVTSSRLSLSPRSIPACPRKMIHSPGRRRKRRVRWFEDLEQAFERRRQLDSLIREQWRIGVSVARREYHSLLLFTFDTSSAGLEVASIYDGR